MPADLRNVFSRLVHDERDADANPVALGVAEFGVSSFTRTPLAMTGEFHTNAVAGRSRREGKQSVHFGLEVATSVISASRNQCERLSRACQLS
jgi:hypothetical protein